MERVYDVFAVASDMRDEEEPRAIGQADDTALDKIIRRTHKYDTKAEEKLETFLTSIGFDKPDAYSYAFERVLDAHGVDFIQFEKFYSRSKNLYKDFLQFTGAGETDFYEVVKPRIVGKIDSRSKQQTGWNIKDPYGFYNDLCKIAFAQSRTAVGECEFMLAVLTEGLKGKTGDIGLRAGGLDYEIGTQKKIISKSIKDIAKKTVPTPGNVPPPGNIWDSNSNKNLWWTEQNLNEWIYFKEANMDVKFTGLQERVEKLAAKELQQRATDVEARKRLFCSCVLHKYITSHGDRCIVVFNGGTSGQYGPVGKIDRATRGDLTTPEYREAERAGTEFKRCRWLELGEPHNDAEWVFRHCVDGIKGGVPWFTFAIDSGLNVRISFRPS